MTTDTPSHDEAEAVAKKKSKRPRSSRWKRRTIWLIVVLFVVWLVAAGVEVLLGVRDDARGMAQVQDAKNAMSASDVVSGSAIGPLRLAGTDFTAGTSWLRSVVLDPIEILPVMGRQLRSARDLSTAATQTAHIGVTALSQGKTILASPHSGGEARIQTLRSVSELASTTYSALSKINPGTGDALLSPLASKHDTFVRDLNQLRTTLHNASLVTASVANVLQGPDTYLVLMGNNAEMRDGSGMFLEAGVLTADDGSATLSDLQLTAPLELPPGKVVVTGDLQARWGFLQPGVDWRNIGLSPQFDVNGALAARMWAADTGQTVDGVLAVDIDTVQQLMEVTGPVTLANGNVVTADTVVQYLLHDQYAGLNNVDQTAQQIQAQEARQDQLGSLTKAVFGELQGQSLDLKDLADAVSASARGRHILMWSAQPATEAAWEAGGVAGQLQRNSLMAAVMNGGGNKLDQYLTVHVGLNVQTHHNETDATLTVQMTNQTPPGQSQFIAGPYPGLGNQYGEYEGFLAVNVPGYASVTSVVGNPKLDAIGTEGPTGLVAVPVDIKAGQEQTMVIHFACAGVHGTMAVVPSARATPEQWSYQGHQTTDAAPFDISW